MNRHETIQLTPKEAFREAMDKISADYEDLYLQYVQSNCMRCLNTPKQKDRDCGIFYGCKDLCCDTMDSWIHKKQKEKKEKIMADAIRDLQKRGT